MDPTAPDPDFGVAVAALPAFVARITFVALSRVYRGCGNGLREGGLLHQARDRVREHGTAMLSMIDSMTPAERAKPELLKASRKRRIAAGAGVSVQEVNRLLAQFEQTQKMMKMVARGGMQKMLRGLKGGFPGLR